MISDLRVSSESDVLVDLSIEATLLGILLADNTKVALVLGLCGSEDFANDTHGLIFNAIVTFESTGRSANPASLAKAFEKKKLGVDEEYLNDLANAGAISFAAEECAALIGDLSARRNIRETSRNLISGIENDFVNAPYTIVSENSVDGITGSRKQPSKAISSHDTIAIIMERQKRIESGQQSIGCSNRLLPDLDNQIGRLVPQRYIILAGRPGMGKTALAMSAAFGYSLNGHIGRYYHGEMSEEDVAMRHASDASFYFNMRIKNIALSEGRLMPEDYRNLSKIEEKLAFVPLTFQNIKGLDVDALARTMRSDRRRAIEIGKPIEFFVVDYLGLLRVFIKGEEIHDQTKKINYISSRIRELADELEMPIIALSQINRGVEGRSDQRPTMADLKDSSQLEADADVVALLYREEYYLRRAIPNETDKCTKTGFTLKEIWQNKMADCNKKIEVIVDKVRGRAPTTKRYRIDLEYFAARSITEFPDEDDSSFFNTGAFQ